MNITFFTGAGISEASGIPTFRTSGEDSIWNKYDPNIVCNIEAWPEHKETILEFFNKVMDLINACEPNEAHEIISDLEHRHTVHIITTNVDDLHERAGSTNIIHIHGNVFESCDINGNHIKPNEEHINIGDLEEKSNMQRRHNVVMFGEMPQNLIMAKTIINQTDILVVIGSSLSVYPANLLVLENKAKKIIYIDTNIDYEILEGLDVETIQMDAIDGLNYLKTINDSFKI